VTTVEDVGTASPVTGVEAEGDELRRGRPLVRRVWLALGGLLIAVGAGAWLWTTNESTGGASADTGPVATAVVERGTIAATSSWDGTLDYGAPVTVRGSANGTVTRLVDQGATVEPGAELYRVNEQPIIMLQGEVPMYRELEPGVAGVDVGQMETNLAQLGYGGFTVDDEYTWSTAEAVRAWQAAIGAPSTGTVARGDVIFVSEGRRVDNLHVDVGGLVTPGAPVLDITSTQRVVTLPVDIDDRELVDVGTEVAVVLPGGNEAPGTVSTTTVAEVPADDTGGGPEGDATDSESIVQVEITLDGQVPDDLVGATVEVIAAIDERADVLLVPVNALLALAESGYGLEVVGDDGTTSIVPVTTGLFADGKVQVDGDGISEGTVVGVAGR
jgi:peptidoglycan hydrolase-like protein with peptidoglycan-binding domain